MGGRADGLGEEGPDLPLASARSDMITQSRPLMSSALALGCLRVEVTGVADEGVKYGEGPTAQLHMGRGGVLGTDLCPLPCAYTIAFYAPLLHCSPQTAVPISDVLDDVRRRFQTVTAPAAQHSPSALSHATPSAKKGHVEPFCHRVPFTISALSLCRYSEFLHRSSTIQTGAILPTGVQLCVCVCVCLYCFTRDAVQLRTRQEIGKDFLSYFCHIFSCTHSNQPRGSLQREGLWLWARYSPVCCARTAHATAPLGSAGGWRLRRRALPTVAVGGSVALTCFAWSSHLQTQTCNRPTTPAQCMPSQDAPAHGRGRAHVHAHTPVHAHTHTHTHTHT